MPEARARFQSLINAVQYISSHNKNIHADAGAIYRPQSMYELGSRMKSL
jgi:hypothetical protein